jgi:uncharacterized protein YndB with AHSA1/START domain
MPVGNESDVLSMNKTTLELPSDREILITRAFNGPARVVFDAFTKPELVARWWAPKPLGVSLASCDADVRVGGTYRYVMQIRTRGQAAFSGTYLEVTPPSRVVYTQFYEPTAGGVGPDDVPITVTVTFDERDGKTYLTSRTLCPTKELRDGIIASGMETGMRATMDQLEELVAALS